MHTVAICDAREFEFLPKLPALTTNGIGSFESYGESRFAKNNRWPPGHPYEGRRKKRLRYSPDIFADEDREFVQPPKVYAANRNPSTSIAALRGTEISRTNQLEGQPAKAFFSKASGRKENKLKPYALEAPTSAHLLSTGKYSDFHPWRGNHQEDRVTDAQAKNGQCDKLVIGRGNNEQASARATLYPLLKQRTGIPALSHLFLTTLCKRQRSSRVSSTSTFKPPPRVTLPDQRREAWLRDLANPSVPLRKLSRTIPHGLKGPLLLDQCSAKEIPTLRAVWFARCIGANELRGLKRKGVGSFAIGGEAKWIREWTIQVTDYLDNHLKAFMKETSRSRAFVYATRLAMYLYTERLLDRAYLLEWFLSLIEGSTDTFPLLYALVSTAWIDLLLMRRIKTQLFRTLLERPTTFCEVSCDIWQPLTVKISAVTTRMVYCQDTSLLPNKDYTMRRNALDYAIDGRIPLIRQMYDSLADESTHSLCPTSTRSSVFGKRHVIQLLDEAAVPYDIDLLMTRCSAISEPPQLIRILCEWAVTSFRAGLCRVYVAVALLEITSHEGVDVEKHLLLLIDRIFEDMAIERHNFYLFMSELVRRRLFSYSSYMRWLIARGHVTGFSPTEQSLEVHVRLLSELSVGDLPARLQNLRSTLLSSCKIDVGDERQTLVDMRLLLESRGIFRIYGSGNERVKAFTSNEISRLRGLSRALKSELALWIKQQIQSLLNESLLVGQGSWRDSNIRSNITTLTATQFIFLRQVLEELSDIFVLSDVVRLFSTFESSEILAQCAEAVTYHLNSFSTFHSINYYLQPLFSKYKKLHARRSVERCLLDSLLELALTSSVNTKISQELEYDHEMYNQRYPRSAIVQSPISETFDECLHDGAPSSNDEIDRLWSTNAIVSRGTLSRLFETTVSTVETLCDDRGDYWQLHTASYGLIRLRQILPELFDELLKDWISRVVCSSQDHSFRNLSILAASGCLSLELLLSLIVQNETSDSVTLDSLELLLKDDLYEDFPSTRDYYTIKARRQNVNFKKPSLLIRLLFLAIISCSHPNKPDLSRRLNNILSFPSLLDHIRRIAITDQALLLTDLIEPLSTSSDVLIRANLHRLLDNTFADQESTEWLEVDTRVQVIRVVHLVNDYSLALCQLKFWAIFSSIKHVNGLLKHSYPFDRSNFNVLVKSLIRGMFYKFQERQDICYELIAVFTGEWASQLRNAIEELLLKKVTSLSLQELLDDLEIPFSECQGDSAVLALVFASIIEVTGSGIPIGGSIEVSTLLGHRFGRFVQAIDVHENDVARNCETLLEQGCSECSKLRAWSVVFLRLTLLPFAQNSLAQLGQGHTIISIYSIIDKFVCSDSEEFLALLLETALACGEDATDDTIQNIKRFLRNKWTSPLPRYLTGPIEGSRDCLYVYQRRRLSEYPSKVWELLAEPTPTVGENDTCLGLNLFKARRSK